MPEQVRTVHKIESIHALRQDVTNPEVQKKRVAAYARVSTDSDEQLTSYAAQVAFYSHYIKENPEWEFVSVYTDEGISGTNTHGRDGFNRMIADAMAGKIEIKLAYLIQRIGTEYLKNRRNKGFRHIWRDRKPFSFYDSSIPT